MDAAWKDVLTPATVWTGPEATLLSQVSRTRKDKRGRICEAPGAVKPRGRTRRQGVQCCSYFLGTEFRRQVGSSGVRRW